MPGQIKVILKKIFSIALIFNALVTISSSAGILYGFYHSYPYWKPYAPWLLDGNLFWVAIAAGVINLFPSASIGRSLHVGRFLFHHYVYGFVVLIITSACALFFTNIPFLYLFFVDSTDVTVNALRAFELGGLTLLLDDLPDVNHNVERWLNWTKNKMCKVRKSLFALQFATGCLTLYCGVSVVFDSLDGTSRLSQNLFIVGTMLITALTSFALVKRKAWLNLT